MPRKPKPYQHQGWFVTEAGGRYTKLCPVRDGIDRATELLALLLSGQPLPPPTTGPQLTLAAAFALHQQHAQTYYTLPNGKPSNEIRCFVFSWTHLLRLHGNIPAADLRRPHVQEARDAMIAAKQSRKVINQSVGRIKRAVRWLAEQGHVPDDAYTSLTVMKNLSAHRSKARETSEVKPVSESDFRTTLIHLPHPWETIARLQWYTGMRPGEACGLRVSHLDTRRSDTWVADFRRDHKMAYRGKLRVVPIGPRGIELIRSRVDVCRASNRDALFRVRSRQSPVTVSSYAHAVEAAAEAAGVAHWFPNQLRHSYLTRVRQRFGLDVAQAAGGHARADVTQVYAEVNLEKAELAARELG